jgi:hypothetical protein
MSFADQRYYWVGSCGILMVWNRTPRHWRSLRLRDVYLRLTISLAVSDSLALVVRYESQKVYISTLTRQKHLSDDKGGLTLASSQAQRKRSLFRVPYNFGSEASHYYTSSSYQFISDSPCRLMASEHTFRWRQNLHAIRARVCLLPLIFSLGNDIVSDWKKPENQ